MEWKKEARKTRLRGSRNNKEGRQSRYGGIAQKTEPCKAAGYLYFPTWKKMNPELSEGMQVFWLSYRALYGTLEEGFVFCNLKPYIFERFLRILPKDPYGWLLCVII
ncbi:MAG: hypothetical protein LBB80_01790 [Treponema sp.]|jgi:hypothetical protein|nr:hypothetical protein [Treponema sp.]